MKKILLTIGLIATGLLSTSCEKFLDIEPQGKIIPVTTEDYRKFITAAYDGYPTSKSLIALRADESTLIIDFDGNFLPYKDIYTFNEVIGKSSKNFAYTAFYKGIFTSNQIINQGVKTMEEGNDKNQLLAEAYGLRAISFFDLANLYADVYMPGTEQAGIVLETEIQIEYKKPKNTLKEVYTQIHSDIENALELVNVEQWEVGKNYRFSKLALYTLQARVYLYQKDYANALAAAEKAYAIKSTLMDFNKADDSKTSVADFTNPESILALDYTLHTDEQSVINVSPELINSYTEGDLRLERSYQKKDEEYTVVKTGSKQTKVTFRTTELYFIIAEAAAKLNNLEYAKQTISTVIRARYTNEAADSVINTLNTISETDFISFLLNERYKEFAFEGQRWYDLRRLDQKEITHTVEGKESKLFANDKRYTISFPTEAKQNNPNL